MATIPLMSSGPRPQGPKKKSTVKVPSSGGGDGARNRLIAMAAAAGVLIIAVGAGFVLFGGSSSASAANVPKLFATAGCSFQSVKALKSNDHTVLTPGGTSKKWNTFPPTNGPHFQTPAVWGAYSDPLQQAQVVHNLEHGGIFIQYGKDVPLATIVQLKAFYDQHLNGTLLAPLPALGSKIALGVWTTKSPSKPDDGTAYVAKCTAFDEAAFSAFFKAYQFKGPERFPMIQLTPGN